MATTYEEILNLFRETDRKFQEVAESQKDTDRKFQDTDRKFQDTAQKLNQLEKLFTSQWGKLMESLVEGDLVNLLIQRGIPIADTTTRLKGKRPDGGNYEFDLSLIHISEPTRPY